MVKMQQKIFQLKRKAVDREKRVHDVGTGFTHADILTV